MLPAYNQDAVCCRFPYEAAAKTRQSVGLQHSYLPGSSMEVCAPPCAGKVAAATEMPVTQSGNRLTTFPDMNVNVPVSHPEYDVGQSSGAASQPLWWSAFQHCSVLKAASN